MTNLDVIHADPVWRDRADFIIGARLPEPGRSEQLWARRLDDDRFEICCVPFFVYGMALGDHVEVDHDLNISRVVAPSGRAVFRVGIEEPACVDEIVRVLTALGGLLEWSSSSLIAVDAADIEIAGGVTRYLADQERTGALVYETGDS